MIVGFDISQIAHPGGVATYTQNLAKHLASRSELEMVYFYSSLRKPYLGDLVSVKKYPFPPTLLELVFNHLRIFSIDSLIGRVDIFHSSDWIQPKTKAKKVTTYHDVIPLKYPQWSHPKIVEVHKKRLELVEKEIDIVIAVSEATKKDLLEVSKIPQEKIVVIYEGVDNKFKQMEQDVIKEFRKKYQLPDEFILSFGGIGERKNIARIKEACKGYNLIVTGEDIWVEDEELPLLYNSALMLLYPSLYEGFGLPIIEAMACGTPVITSNVSSMPEVGGEAARYIDPTDLDETRGAIREIRESGKIREGMIKKGFEQAKKFSWEKCAKETTFLYKKILN